MAAGVTFFEPTTSASRSSRSSAMTAIPRFGFWVDLRVRRHLRARVRQRVEERRLPGVGKADDADPEAPRGRLGAEAGARLACVSLRVEHAGEDEQDDAVLGL